MHYVNAEISTNLVFRKNWDVEVAGSCQPREYQTALSFAVAAVSISTDWTFACLPVFLLWNVQMDPRVKLSVVVMLGLGVLYVYFAFVMSREGRTVADNEQCLHCSHRTAEIPCWTERSSEVSRETQSDSRLGGK